MGHSLSVYFSEPFILKKKKKKNSSKLSSIYDLKLCTNARPQNAKQTQSLNVYRASRGSCVTDKVSTGLKEEKVSCHCCGDPRFCGLVRTCAAEEFILLSRMFYLLDLFPLFYSGFSQMFLHPAGCGRL